MIHWHWYIFRLYLLYTDGCTFLFPHLGLLHHSKRMSDLWHSLGLNRIFSWHRLFVFFIPNSKYSMSATFKRQSGNQRRVAIYAVLSSSTKEVWSDKDAVYWRGEDVTSLAKEWDSFSFISENKIHHGTVLLSQRTLWKVSLLRYFP